MPELRKRQAPDSASGNVTKKSTSSVAVGHAKSDKEQVEKGGKIEVGDFIDVKGFGGEVETHEGTRVTLQSMNSESKNGVVIFTYPKASTPGCTTQACLFRDDFVALTASGLNIYGLSKDSPKSNTAFKTKQNLPYTLLSDPKETLITAIGMKKSPTGTTRGVIVIDKEGKVQVWHQGGPAATVEYIRKFVDHSRQSRERTKEGEPSHIVGEKEDQIQANVAAQVADTAQELDK